MILSGRELVDILITAVAASFIFSGMLQPVRKYETFAQKLLLAGAVVVPAIVLHEFGHKFVALGLGYDATFHAAYTWLALGVVLKLLSFPFIFVVPAYVATVGASGMDRVLIAAAGPLVNLAIAGVCYAWFKLGKHDSTRLTILYFSAQINLFLGIFNLLPIPGFDGSHVWAGIMSLL